MFPNSNIDDWKWATEESCIHNEITSYKIPTLIEEHVRLDFSDFFSHPAQRFLFSKSFFTISQCFNVD